MRVVVVGNIAHVVVDGPVAGPELAVRDNRQSRVELALDLDGRRVDVRPPHHHRHQADFAVSDPAEVVVKVSRRQRRGFTEIASHGNFTFTMMVER